MENSFSAGSDRADGPYVLGVDVGSGGARAGVYTASGREVPGRSTRVAHSFHTAPDGTSTIDADQVVAEIGEAIAEATAGLGAPIAAVGIDTFASSLVPVGNHGDALGPCITYADTRCHAQVTRLRELLDVERLHDVTGARVHSSYLTPRLLWLRESQPELFSGAARFMALGEYVAHKLLGQPALGTAADAWGGMIDRNTGQYVPELLEAAGVGADQLGHPLDPNEVLPVSGTPLARLAPTLADAVWVPVIGDGLAANLGIGARGRGTWGISTATSGAIRMFLDTPVETLPGGLWAYRVDARRTLFGSAMSDCGRVLDYARATFRIPQDLADIDTAALFGADPTPGTPLVVPFLSGERGTKWRDGVRAIFAGVGAATTPEQWLRGTMEGLALAFLRIADQLREAGGAPERIFLSGGMTNAVPGWVQILADALDATVEHVDVKRSTMRGAALLALEQIGETDIAEVPVRSRVEPVPGRADYYRERLAWFEELADHG